jgi:PAS domain S-box-containing protein
MDDTQTIDTTFASVNGVLITEELERRPRRPRNYEGENRGLVTLAHELAQSPRAMLQKLVEVVLEVCGAGSSGVSILEAASDEPVFRWHAIAGEWAQYAKGTLPRYASPCGTVVDRDCALLFENPARFFADAREMQPPMHEVLLVPFRVRGKVVGTVWAISHRPEHRFDAEDERLLNSLSHFAAASYSLIEQQYAASESRAERMAALNLMEDAISARQETERASAALRESEERYRTLFESIDEGFCTIEVLFSENGKPVDFRFLRVNPAFERQSGIENAVGRTMREIAPQHEELWFETYGRVAETGEPVRFESEAAQLGSWYDVYAFRVEDPQLRRVGILFNNITHRKRSEEALRVSEERFRAYVTTSSDVVYSMNADWTKMRSLVGKDFIPDTQNTNRSWLETYIHPEDQPQVLQTINEAIRTKSIFELEHRVVRVDGNCGWTLSRAIPLLDAAGEITGFLGTAHDVTNRKRAEEALRASEERLRLLLESVEDYAIFAITKDGRIVTWNPGAERIFGYTVEEIIGEPGDILFTPEDRERGEHEKEVKEALSQGHAEDERWHIRKDGSRFYASGVLRPLEDGVQGFVKVCRDLTQQKQSEADLQGAHVELQRAHDELEQRVLERTTALRSEILQRQELEHAREQLLQRVVNAQEEERHRISRELHDQMGQQLTALLMGLKSLLVVDEPGIRPPSFGTRVETLHLLADGLMRQMHDLAWRLRPTSLDTFGLEPALRQHVQEWSQQSGIAADFVARGFPPGKRLSPDVETAFYRVVQEALTNVQRHSGARYVSVLLKSQDQQVSAIVEDDGHGFHSAQGADGTTRVQSTRLGLLGMQERMDLVKGTLTIESTPGQGTALYARVPVENS